MALNISIHAPVKGATEAPDLHEHQHGISIHAPVKGATIIQRRGRILRIISIHPPVKGATSPWVPYTGTVQDFNPRSREGSDQVPPMRFIKVL